VGRLLAVMVVVSACGRLDFKPASSDVLLPCGQPTRFQVGAGTVSALVAVAQPAGYGLFITDTSNALRGWAYTFEGTTLVATAENVTLAGGVNGSLGVAAQGSTTLLSSKDGHPAATGTTLFLLGDALGTLATASSRAGQFAASYPVAAGVTGGFAFATIDATSGEVDVRRVAENGVDAGAAVKIIDGAAKATGVSIVPAGGGYVVTYQSGATSPNPVEIELLDASFAVTAGPVAVDHAVAGEFRATVAVTPSAFLVTWNEKNITNDDDVWIVVLGPDLSTLVPAKVVAHFSTAPLAVANADGFWLAYKTYAPTPNHAGAQHVALDGTVTSHPVSGSGGALGAFAMIERVRQPVLAWTEVGGSGPDLYLDPLCPP
jgi:hypothetical protein